MDDILNTLLFLLIGLEVLALDLTVDTLLLALVAIPVLLAARAIGVGLPVYVLPAVISFTRATVPILVWGGVRGGISVALALALPAHPLRDALLTATYGVVIFSIIVQGLPIAPLAARLFPKAEVR